MQLILTFFLLAAAATSVSGQTDQPLFHWSFQLTNSYLRVTPAAYHQLFRETQAITITSVNNAEIRIVDWHGNLVYRGMSDTRTYPPGHYFVETSGDRSQFAVLPADYRGAAFLCLQALEGPYPPHDELLPSWLRCGRDWHRVETGDGVYDWEMLDRCIANRGQRQMIVIVGGSIPRWIPSDNVHMLVERYVRYATMLITRYRGQIAAVEIWNEPARDKFWNRPDWLAILNRLTTDGAAAIHRVDPTIKVVGGAWDNPYSFRQTANLTAMGLTRIIDVYSWHDYRMPKTPPEGVFLNTKGSAQPYQEACVKLYREALGDTTIPVWVTELGLSAQSGLGINYTSDRPLLHWRRGMARTFKCAVLYRAAGVEVLMPHLIYSCPSSLDGNGATSGVGASVNGWEYGDRGPQPKTSAFILACYWLNGATLMHSESNSTLLCYRWRRPNREILTIAWAPEGITNSVDQLPGHRTDIFGQPVTGPITEEPQLWLQTTTP